METSRRKKGIRRRDRDEKQEKRKVLGDRE